MTYPLTAAQAKLAELVAEARRSHRPVTISEHGKPVAALINVDDLADLEDRAALAAHLADKAAGRGGISLEELDAALDRIDAETSHEPDRRLPRDGVTQPRPYPR
jgi:prevent-host-death family protein